MRVLLVVCRELVRDYKRKLKVLYTLEHKTSSLLIHFHLPALSTWPGDTWSQDISNHVIDPVKPG